MKNILVFCRRDWNHPKAGFVERYAHKVFSRIAAEGNYVGWVCQNQLFPSVGKPRPPQVEIVDGIQMARLAPSLLYRTMAKMFLARLEKRKEPTRRIDAIVDCVVGEPMPLNAATQTPVVPLVFDLSKKIQASDTPPGPVIAATVRARQQLFRAGLPAKFLIQAPAGVDVETEQHEPGAGEKVAGTAASIVAVDDSPRRFRAALRVVQDGGINMSVNLMGLNEVGALERRRFYNGARIGYCGIGAEEEALAFAARGVPVICPHTDAAAEFVLHGETGLLHKPGDSRAIAECIRTLARNEVMYARMAEKARETARARSWERTASLVLAAIENL